MYLQSAASGLSIKSEMFQEASFTLKKRSKLCYLQSAMEITIVEATGLTTQSLGAYLWTLVAKQYRSVLRSRI